MASNESTEADDAPLESVQAANATEEGQSSSIEMTTPVRRSSVIRGLLNSFNSLTTSGQYESTDNNENELTLGTTSASVDDYDTSMSVEGENSPEGNNLISLARRISIIIPPSLMPSKSTRPRHKRKFRMSNSIYSYRFYRKLGKRINAFMESPPVQLFLAALLCLSLFLSDSYILANAPDSENDRLYGVLTVVFSFFCVETIILTFVQPGYFLGFFFWMDIVGTISIILDIGWISSGSAFGSSKDAVQRVGSILRTTRAAKLGARYARITRIVRICYVYMVEHYCKFLKNENKGVNENEPTLSAVRRVSEELSAILSQRIAALVMMFVIVVPFLSYDISDTSCQAWVDNLGNLLVFGVTNAQLESDYIPLFQDYYSNQKQALYELTVETPSGDIYEHYITRTDDIVRNDNQVLYTSTYEINSQTYSISAIMDTTDVAMQNSRLTIVLVILVIFALFAFSVSFQSSVDKLVVIPLEKMMTTLRLSATSMLKSVKAYNDEKVKDEEASNVGGDDDDDENLEEELETAVLEKLVNKLSRIVSNILPENSTINVSNIDSATASWLSSTYSVAKQEMSNKVAEEEDLRTKLARHETLRMSLSQHVQDHSLIDSWYLDVLEYNQEQLHQIVKYIFAYRNYFDYFHIKEKVFSNFLTSIFGRYKNENSYHNFKHACDVCHTVYRLLSDAFLFDIFNPIESFSLLVAALAHDVGHPGLNNHYLIKSNHQLAIAHNDKSPLENMHCVVLYELILGAKDTNIFNHLSPADWKASRKIVLAAILGTDMGQHFEQVKKLNLFNEVNGDDTRLFCRGDKQTIECFKEEDNRLFVLEIVLHAADISNPYKPFAICKKWANLVVEEFFAQGDREKREGLEISPQCNRDLSIGLPNMQLGFLEAIVTPLVSTVVHIFPPLYEVGEHMRDNFQIWAKERLAEIPNDPKIEAKDKENEQKKLTDRVKAYTEKWFFVQEYSNFPTRKNHLFIHNSD